MARTPAVERRRRPKTPLDRDFFLLHTIYGISLVVGFEKLGESTYSLALSYFGTTPVLPAPRPLLLLLAAAVAFVGMRFFWAVDNIVRFIEDCERKNSVPHNQLIAIHYPILFLHAFVFFFICSLHLDLSKPREGGFAHPYFFVYMSAALLIGNAIWLRFLARGRNCEGRELRWGANNLSCGVAMVCAAGLLQHCGAKTTVVLWMAFIVLLGNSLIDIFTTSRAYVQDSDASVEAGA